MKIADINLNKDNPRQISEAKLESLKKSIRDFEKMLSLRPIVVDETNTVLGGNMRLRALQALGYDEIPDEWVKQAADLTEAEKRQFIIKDNVGFGEWDWDALGNEWNADELTDWGLEIPEWAALDPGELGEEFSLPEGDREPFQQMTFTLADEQAQQLNQAITDAKALEEYKYIETFGNENGNGNALYLIIMQWAGQKILG